MTLISKEEQIDLAKELLDYCKDDLSIKAANNFFGNRRYSSYALDLTEEEQRSIFLTAYSLISNQNKK